MIQYFVKECYPTSFETENHPKLVYVSNVKEEFSVHPRILHKHDDRFELFLITEGEGVYHLGTKFYHVKKGDIVLCNSGQLHDEILGEKNIISSLGMGITNLRVDELPENHFIGEGEDPIVHTESFFPVIQSLMNNIHHMLSSKKQNIYSCHHIMLSIIALTKNIMEEQKQGMNCEYKKGLKKDSFREHTDMLVTSIKEYLDANYREEITLQSISSVFNIDIYYLSHIFKKKFMYSPMQYVHRRRIGEAQTLLICTTRKITEISSEVGFGNPNNFNIQFKKYVGISPLSYRYSYVESNKVVK